jgi:hypothetical protein
MKVTVTVEIETGWSTTVGTSVRSKDTLELDPDVLGRAIEEASRAAGSFEQTWALARAVETAIDNSTTDGGQDLLRACERFLSDGEECETPTQVPPEAKNVP